jgi:hypothetical protein
MKRRKEPYLQGKTTPLGARVTGSRAVSSKPALPSGQRPTLPGWFYSTGFDVEVSSDRTGLLTRF